MPITFQIPGPLRSFSAGNAQVHLAASPTTLLEALEVLFTACPGIRDRVLTENGAIREHINIFIGNESVRYSGGLATPIPESSEISIIPAISGGTL
jgi:molybdopterin synthase sulfur carrier subunit